MFKLAVFVSGRGSNLRSIVKDIDEGHLDAQVSFVISDKLECPALDFASRRGIKTYSVANNEKDNFVNYDFLIDEFLNQKIDLIVLAGFLKKIPDSFVDNFINKIINIHPALLPAFGGKGMYGSNVHKAVFNSSAKVSGATVHFVNKIYDDGKIIAQKAVDISDIKSPDDIAGKVLEVEHQLLPYVISKFVENKIKLIDNRVVIE